MQLIRGEIGDTRKPDRSRLNFTPAGLEHFNGSRRILQMHYKILFLPIKVAFANPIPSWKMH